MAAGKDPDWQGNSNLKDCNKHLLENELYTDVEFQVGDEGTLIKAHKLMLAKRSPVFERMLYGPMAETKYPIVISDIEPEAFRALLRYCYHEERRVGGDIALSTMYTAKKYLLPALERISRRIVIDNLTSENIWEVYTTSVVLHDKKLHLACQEFFGWDVEKIAKSLKSPDFLNIPYCVLNDMLQLNDSNFTSTTKPDEIVISEIEIFKACNAWAEAECIRQKIKPSGPNKRIILGECLFLIRFRTMLAEDLVDIVFPADILKQDEKLSFIELKNSGCCSNSSSIERFLKTCHRYKVEIKVLRGAGSILDYSHLKECEVEYSSLPLMPKANLMLFGFITPIDKEMPGQTKHEVIITSNSKDSPWSKTIVAYSAQGQIRRGPYRFRYIYFEEVLLKANCEYDIQVENQGTKCEEEKSLKKARFSRKIKHELDLSIDLKCCEYNSFIFNLLVRLV